MTALLTKQSPFRGVQLHSLEKGFSKLVGWLFIPPMQWWGGEWITHSSIQLFPTSCCKQVCLNYMWPQEGVRLRKPGKTRIWWFICANMGNPSSMLGVVCWGRSTHTPVNNPFSERKPSKLIDSSEWTLAESSFVVGTLERRMHAANVYTGSNF